MESLMLRLAPNSGGDHFCRIVIGQRHEPRRTSCPPGLPDGLPTAEDQSPRRPPDPSSHLPVRPAVTCPNSPCRVSVGRSYSCLSVSSCICVSTSPDDMTPPFYPPLRAPSRAFGSRRSSDPVHA